ncbi:MAG: glycoside hydrolase domain-containing protein [Verrucomicrobiota bacterium]
MSPSSVVSDPLTWVDPFIGHAATHLPEQGELSRAWFWPKAQVGNTHPGAVTPFGMVSVLPYSGSYPTGYGLYGRCTEGQPVVRWEKKTAIGFTHFQQTGCGDMRLFYNYFRVVPLVAVEGKVPGLDDRWELVDEQARPGRYTAGLKDFAGEGNLGAELTVSPKCAVHRYTFPEGVTGRLAVDLSFGGVDGSPEDRWVSAEGILVERLSAGSIEGTVTFQGIPFSFYLSVDGAGGASGFWHDGRVLPGEHLSLTEIESGEHRWGFYVDAPGPGATLELRIAFSLRGVDQAIDNFAEVDGESFDEVAATAEAAWRSHLEKIEVEGGTDAQRTQFYSAFYQSLIKPCDLTDESPFWLQNTPFFTDLSTMWDIYKTQLPLVMSLYPATGQRFIEALLKSGEHIGHLPVGYVLGEGIETFHKQCSAIAHLTIYDAFIRGYDIDWLRALDVMLKDFATGKGAVFLRNGYVHPFTHTLDLAEAASVTAQIAHAMGKHELFEKMQNLAERWRYVYDEEDGRLGEADYYEGGAWNYSFRLHYDMVSRIALYPSVQDFVADLDDFFGYGQSTVTQLGDPPTDRDLERAGYALNRFTGLNNEPDMETPYAYIYAGRPDRTAEVVREVMRYQFRPEPGGLPGNDDSGALSSWYVWSATGLFPVGGQNLFLIGSPIFTRTVWHLPGGDFEIRAPEASETAKYVVGASLNGRPLERAYLRWSEFGAEGGLLELEMAEQPGTWAQKKLPFTKRLTSGLANSSQHEKAKIPAPFPYADW